MNNIPETFTDYFDKLYNKNGYLDKYGGSVVAAVITMFSFFILLCSE